MTKNSLRNGPGTGGYYGEFGSRYAPEILMPNLIELEKAFNDAINDKKFIDEFEYYLKEWVGRPNPLYFAEQLTKQIGGAKIYFKSDHLNHLGAHKLNNSLFQILLAKRMSKKKIYAETGAGAHLIATAAACAKFNLPCIGYMGHDDVIKQSTNVLKAKLFGAKVVECFDGTGEKGVLKDACTAVLKAWSSDPDAFYCCGSAIGPHPFPRIVQYAQSVIGREIREQIMEKEGRLPDAIAACIGGGSNLIGAVHEFLDDSNVKMIAVEAAGHGINTENHAASLTGGKPGVLHGNKTYLLQSDTGQIKEAHSISAGLDYPGIGPEHSYLFEKGRVKYESATDKEALDAFQYCCKLEGIIPALEPAHALAVLKRIAKNYDEKTIIVMNMCGRGDKDIFTVADELQIKL